MKSFKENNLTKKIEKTPYFYSSDKNAGHILRNIMLENGWEETSNLRHQNLKLQWTFNPKNITNKDNILMNHVTNSRFLTNKYLMYKSLKTFSSGNDSVVDFLPETFSLNSDEERKELMKNFKKSDIWVCKSSKMNRGVGIYLVRSLDRIPMKKDAKEKILQRYISDPLLLNNKKFDIRCYMLIASTQPYLVLFRHGYVRVSIQNYKKDSTNLVVHLTNQSIQNTDPNYTRMKEDLVWSMQRLNSYLNEKYASKGNLEYDWVKYSLTQKLKSIMHMCIDSVKNKLIQNVGNFQLFGLDFLIDKNFKVWLIEFNSSPSMRTNCLVLRTLVPRLLRETLGIVMECYAKTFSNRPLVPLSSLKSFEIIYSPTNQSVPGPKFLTPRILLNPIPSVALTRTSGSQSRKKRKPRKSLKSVA